MFLAGPVRSPPIVVVHAVQIDRTPVSKRHYLCERSSPTLRGVSSALRQHITQYHALYHLAPEKKILKSVKHLLAIFMIYQGQCKTRDYIPSDDVMISE